MKKIMISLAVLLVTGCSVSNKPSSPVEDYLSSYTNLEYAVLLDLEKVVSEEPNMTDDQKELYRDILKKQYEDLKYEILEESEDENTGIVKVKVTVYDYYKTEKNSADYLKNNIEDFYDENGEYSSELYINYKLNNLKLVTDKIEYNIEFEVEKQNDIWKLNIISEEDLQKIHGIYNYEN